LVKPDLGVKRVCPQCAARFYDLQKRPIECPKCQFTFEPESLYKQRRTRQPEPVAAAPVVNEAEDEENEEAEENEGAEIVEPVEDEAPVVMSEDDDEVVEEEPEPESAGMSVVDADEEDAAADIEVEAEEEEEEDTLLEEVEDEDEDVSDIIDADISKDEP
jgi:uncharacterized protein (TIGR02300 family)